ncbi:MAG: tRNA (adenosine(37)-N6)-threonylcarbamoyltransferase complex ATPase subunit type 1 TsaE [Myxococcales bacterium]|nr:tRNA (adenosine(37)-N6)-threonylcarbamoyltransferase complex ATPase subunit type 1 TsaE [Myxococcales bacterium]
MPSHFAGQTGAVHQTVALAGLAQTDALGAKLATILRGGDVLTLQGDLGAGKTTLVQAIGRHWGVEDGAIRSPTFSLVNVTEIGELDLVHADLYRLKTADEVQSSGLGELIGASDCICVIEWPEIAEDWLPTEALRIHLAYDPQSDMRFAQLGSSFATRLPGSQQQQQAVR